MKKILSNLGTVALVCLSITGCAETEKESALEQTDVLVRAETTGTNGVLIPIQSDNVLSGGYDAETQVMTIQFRNGYMYEYFGVPSDLWASFIEAQPNPWSEVGYPRLVGEGSSYRRIR